MDVKFKKHPILESPSEADIIKMAETEQGAELLMDWHEDYHRVLQKAEDDPVYNGFSLPQQEMVEEVLKNRTECWIFGGNRCLAGEQEIYDPVQQKSLRVDEIEGGFHVLAYDEVTCQTVIQAVASAPFRKPAQSLYRVQLAQGEEFCCSNSHLVRTFGSYRPIADAVVLDAPKPQGVSAEPLPSSDGFHLVSTLDIDLSTFQPDVFRSWQTVLDCLGDYRLSLHYDDGRLLPWSDIGLDVAPSLADVRARISCCGGLLDDLERKSQHIRLCLHFDLLSTLDDQPLSVDRFVDTECRASCTPCKSVSLSPEGQEWLKAHQQSIVEFSRQLQSSVLSGQSGIVSRCVLALGGNLSYYNIVVKSDFLRMDTVWDFTVPDHHNYFIGETLHHNSGKSFNSARMVMRALLENPGTTIICWAQNEEASIEMQQPYLYQMLPADLRGKVKQQVANVNYNEKSGFTGKKFVLPNGSKCLFRFYSQFIANPKVIEGYRLGAPEEDCEYLNIGTWLDEYYMDDSLIKRLYRRCNDNNAKILTSFTPLDGYTPLVSQVLTGAETIKTMYGKLLKREMPYVMQPVKKSSGVVFFHTERNPFTNFERLADDLVGESEEEIKTIAYGYPVKSITTLFPLFNENVHVVDECPVFNRRDWTCYQVVDPAGARNYAIIWAMVNAQGDVYVVDEWPRRSEYGPWAEHGKSASEGSKWKFGPAAKKIGLDVKGYVEQFKETEAEHGLQVFERVGDSRFFAKENEENLDLFDKFSEHDMDFIPSCGRPEDDGLTKLDEYFWYNVNADVDAANHPRLRVHSRCGNFIHSVINYGKQGKSDEPLKDWIDLARYLVLVNHGDGPEHYSPSAFTAQPLSSAGY